MRTPLAVCLALVTLARAAELPTVVSLKEQAAALTSLYKQKKDVLRLLEEKTQILRKILADTDAAPPETPDDAEPKKTAETPDDAEPKKPDDVEPKKPADVADVPEPNADVVDPNAAPDASEDAAVGDLTPAGQEEEEPTAPGADTTDTPAAPDDAAQPEPDTTPDAAVGDLTPAGREPEDTTSDAASVGDLTPAGEEPDDAGAGDLTPDADVTQQDALTPEEAEDASVGDLTPPDDLTPPSGEGGDVQPPDDVTPADTVGGASEETTPGAAEEPEKPPPPLSNEEEVVDCQGDKPCPCDASHCSNRGLCRAKGTLIRCTCDNGYYGDSCELGGCETFTTCRACVDFVPPLPERAGGRKPAFGARTLRSHKPRGPACGWSAAGACVGLDKDPDAARTCDEDGGGGFEVGGGDAFPPNDVGGGGAFDEPSPPNDAGGAFQEPPDDVQPPNEIRPAGDDDATNAQDEPASPGAAATVFEGESADEGERAPQESTSSMAKKYWKKTRDEVATALTSNPQLGGQAAMAVPALGVILALVALCGCLRSKCRRGEGGPPQRYEKISTAEPRGDVEQPPLRPPVSQKPAPYRDDVAKAPFRHEKSPKHNAPTQAGLSDRERRQAEFAERRAEREAKRRAQQAERAAAPAVVVRHDDDDDASYEEEEAPPPQKVVEPKGMRLGGGASSLNRGAAPERKPAWPAPAPRPDDPFAQIGLSAAPTFDSSGRGVVAPPKKTTTKPAVAARPPPQRPAPSGPSATTKKAPSANTLIDPAAWDADDDLDDILNG